ncbi:hypothetical protein OnM2_054023 [Erysiphe neolycopersici]|uniref:Uncharacterized protein n=1 Tax=Erysiphe neolycopersici TaxID=212602 RepID=A0A420HRT2_9PEZI|nr:hypothetical protein OnM2_054023 [Erysiphe neolycopersici]
MSSIESRLQDAIAAFDRNEFSSQRVAAAAFGISISYDKNHDGYKNIDSLI